MSLSKGMTLLLAAALLLSSLAGCATATVKAEEARSSAPRAQVTPVPAALKALAEGNNAFALDLYGQLRSEPGNLFYSPYSISQAIAMAQAGARGETEKQIAQVMHFNPNQQQLHSSFNAIDQHFTAMGSPRSTLQRPMALRMANSAWGQQDEGWEKAYLDTLAANYGAGVQLTDFRAGSEAARARINEWVKVRTEGKIPELMPAGAVTNQTRLVLVNAVYFKAAWSKPFQKSQTAPAPFNLLDGKQVSVPTMRLTATLRHAKLGDWQAVELPYEGGATGMLLLVPEPGKFAAAEQQLTTAQLQQLIAALQTKQVTLTLPSFKFDSAFSLADTLQAMGMTDAFDGNKADFSGMNGKRNLFIQAVIHKAFVAVDEEGTEAAAATGVTVAETSVISPSDMVTLKVDRPFLFAIQEKQSGNLIFFGRVVNPAG